MKISLVTPSLNQAVFLEQALLSVLDQRHPDLEYVVMDGGSTDGSVEIIRRHADRLAHWESEPDTGQYDALGRGFAMTTGEIMGWLNSDDKLTPWALSVVDEIFTLYPQVEWITTLCHLGWDAEGRAVGCTMVKGFCREAFLRGAFLPGGKAHARWFIQQESTFWRRSLWEKTGGKFDTSLRLAGDFELWARFFEHAPLHGVATPLGGARFHAGQRSKLAWNEYQAECESVLTRYGHSRYGRAEGFLRKVGWRLEDAADLIPPTIRNKVFYRAEKVRWVVDGWRLETAVFL
jgi:glycosyltransferase involved in cell wall biosynthesis